MNNGEKEEVRRKKEEGRRRKEEGGRKKKGEGERRKEEVLVTIPYATPRNGLTLWYEKWIPVRSA